MVAHLAHTSSLNETCDICSMHEKRLRYVRNVTPPHRNTLSNANRTRSAAMAEELFWTVKAALEAKNVTANGKTFNQRGRPKGFLHRFKKAIYAIDSTTIQLVLNCIDWTKHRRRKAAAKAHVLLDITSFLPSVVVVESANHHKDIFLVSSISRIYCIISDAHNQSGMILMSHLNKQEHIFMSHLQ